MKLVYFFLMLPNKSYTVKEEKCNGGKMSKERTTVLVGASMTGERLPLLVIGKLQNPRRFTKCENSAM